MNDYALRFKDVLLLTNHKRTFSEFIIIEIFIKNQVFIQYFYNFFDISYRPERKIPVGKKYEDDTHNPEQFFTSLIGALHEHHPQFSV